jgi:hypothetical protein
MSCPFEAEVLLLRDALGSPARRVVVEAHLARCRSCARIDETLELVGERLRAGDDEPLGIVGKIALPPRRRKWPVAAAAAALVAAVFFAWPSPPVPPVEVAEVPSLPPDPPTLPPPTSRGPALSVKIAALDPAAADYAPAVTELAAHVRAEGALGSSALAALLESEDPRRALDVAVEAPSPALAEPLAALLDRPEFRAAAARALGAAGSWRALLAALDGPAADEALEALVSIGGREVAAALERRCSDESTLDALARIDPARAARACTMEGASGAAVVARYRERLVPELRRLLSDDLLAAGAARRLGEAGDRKSLDDLVRLAGRPATTLAATEALLSLGEIEAAFRAARRLPDAQAAFDGAAQAEVFLIERIGKGPYAERRAALDLLGRCGGAATVRRLATAPVTKNLRGGAALALGAIGGEEAIAALDRFSRERGLRRDVVRALGRTGDPRALPVLQRFVEEDGLAGELSLALSRIHDPESAVLLADLALRENASEDAARALTRMPVEVVVPVLLERLTGTGRTRDLLVQIAGFDHGPRRDRWKQWWDSRP